MKISNIVRSKLLVLKKIRRKPKSSAQTRGLKYFIRTEKERYEKLFFENHASLVINRTNIIIAIVTIFPLNVAHWARSGDWRYLVATLPFIATMGIGLFISSVRLISVRKWLPLVIATGFYFCNVVSLSLHLDHVDIKNPEFAPGPVIFITMTTPIACSIICLLPSILQTLSINCFMIIIYFISTNPVRQALGISNIVPQLIQVAALSFVFSLLLITTIRYRILTTLQRSEIETKGDIIRLEAEKNATILRSIPQGVFIVRILTGVDTGFVIDGGSLSPACEEMLGLPPQGGQLSFSEDFLMRLEGVHADDQRVVLSEVLAAVLESNEITWMINKDHLPESVIFKVADSQKILAMSYAPLYDKQGTVNSVLFLCQDRTDAIEAENNEQHMQAQLSDLSDLITAGRDHGIKMINVISELMRSAEVGVSEILKLGLEPTEKRGELAKKIFVFLHTAKGNARTYGLRRLAASIHELESLIIHIRDSSQLELSLKSLEDKLDLSKSRLADLFQVCKIVGWDASNSISLPWEGFRRIHSQLDLNALRLEVEENRDTDSVAETFLAPSFVMVRRLLPIFQQAISSASKTAKKPIPQTIFEINGRDIWLLNETYEILATMLPHIAANTIDHGIETPDERKSVGKEEVGKVYFRISRNSYGLEISFGDDGRGIDPEKIASTALARNLLSEKKLCSMSLEEKASLIFINGFSTTAIASELSGRGVGMSAVMETLGQLGGSVKIDLSNETLSGPRPFQIRCLLNENHLWV